MAATRSSSVLLGAHCSTAGGLHTAFERAERIGATAIQVFTKNNNQWRAKEITDDDRTRWFDAWRASGVKSVTAHDSYLINLASPQPDLYARSYHAFVEEIRRCHLLGIRVLNFHPGAHTGSGEEAGLALVADALNRAHDETADCPDVISTIECTAGQGTSLGNRFEHLRAIIDRVENSDRVGVCIDTAHVFAAGYDLRDRRAYMATMKLFDEIVGRKRLQLFHLNDSKRDLGSCVDRHEHIGKGFIGKECFRLIMNDTRFSRIPKVLETPKSADLKEDIVNLRLLRRLIAP